MAVEIRRILFPTYGGRMVMKDGAYNERTKGKEWQEAEEGRREEGGMSPVPSRYYCGVRLHSDKRQGELIVSLTIKVINRFNEVKIHLEH